MTEHIDLTKYPIDELKKLKDKIDREMDRQRTAKIQKARNKIQEIVADSGLTIEEVLDYSKKKKSAKAASKAKYCNPNDPGQTWSGRGKRPRWLQEALGKGAKLEDFLIS